MSFKNIYELPTNLRRFLLIIFDSICLLFAVLVSLNNTNNFTINIYLLFWVSTFFIYTLTGNYKSILRYYDRFYIYKNIFRNVLIAFIVSITDSIFDLKYLSNGNLLLFLLMNILFTYFSRLFIKDFIRSVQSLSLKNKKNTIIYGAGAAGNLLTSYINYTSKYNVVCFVDDNPKLINRQINGISIKSAQDLPKLIKTLNVKTIIFAIPSLNINKRRDILLSIQNLSIEILKVPEIEDISLNNSNINKLKTIKIEDLLCRQVVQADQKLMDKDIKNSVVFVTGAGGSIGSELCRQIIALAPKKIIAIDNSEFNLFNLEEKIKFMIPDNVDYLGILGDLKDSVLIKNIFVNQKVDIVFHAAAYKHVPIVESNPIPCILNNVRSSEIICKLSYQCNIKRIKDIIETLHKHDPNALVIFQSDHSWIMSQRSESKYGERKNIFNLIKHHPNCKISASNNINTSKLAPYIFGCLNNN